MLEIIGLLLLCRVNKKNAIAVGKSGGGAIGLTSGLWLGLEFVGAMIGSAAELGMGSYILALVFAAIGAGTSYAIVKAPAKKPGALQTGAGQYGRAPGHVPQPGGCAAVNPYVGAVPQNRFCVRCGQPLTEGAMYCGTCGTPVKPPAQQMPPHAAAAQTASPAVQTPSPDAQSAPPVQRNLFYVFAVQGPAFGSAGGGDMVMEKAKKLKDDYEPAKDMDLKVIRPGQWNSSIQSSHSGGVVSVSYNFTNFKANIRAYLLKEGFPGETVENGIRLCEEKSLQLSNPMSGVFVMGIPLVSENKSPAVQTPSPAAPPAPIAPTVAAAPPLAPAPCRHEYKHFTCVKCGAKAPKPQLAFQGTRKQNQHTYEDYTARTAEEAKYFLEQMAVTQPLYYVMVHTPEGDWGKDKDGLFLSQLCGFQRDLSLRQCDAETAPVPERMSDIQMAAHKVTDNYTLSVTCGGCGHSWIDGVGYRTKTVVRCPECGKYNLADTEHIRFNNL